MKNFINAIETHLNRKHPITIYPEAHIWPYYTKIRPFRDVSFRYPIQYKKPTFCMTNTYQSYGKNRDKVKIVSVHPESIGEYEIGDTFVVASTYEGDDDIYVRDEEGHTYCLLEEEYEVEIPSEDLENLTTVGAVIDYLKGKGVEA